MLSDKLKTQTLQEHKSAEGALNFEKSTANAESYLQLLKAFYGLYAPLELKIFHSKTLLLEAGVDPAPRMKKDLLENDMLDLGMSKKEIADIPVSSELPTTTSLNELLGMMYVLEGSTLGGQVIAKKLKALNILDHEVSFHNPYGIQTMPMWLQLKEILNLQDEKNHDEIITSAKKTFAVLKKWLSSQLQ